MSLISNDRQFDGLFNKVNNNSLEIENILIFTKNWKQRFLKLFSWNRSRQRCWRRQSQMACLQKVPRSSHNLTLLRTRSQTILWLCQIMSGRSAKCSVFGKGFWRKVISPRNGNNSSFSSFPNRKTFCSLFVVGFGSWLSTGLEQSVCGAEKTKTSVERTSFPIARWNRPGTRVWFLIALESTIQRDYISGTSVLCVFFKK